MEKKPKDTIYFKGSGLTLKRTGEHTWKAVYKNHKPYNWLNEMSKVDSK